MPNVFKAEDKGKIRLCKVCRDPFLVGPPSLGLTTVLCKDCGRIINCRNNKELNEEEREIKRAYWQDYSERNRPIFRESGKKWKRNNPRKRYSYKRTLTLRHNEETLVVADSHQQPWTSDEIAYLKEYSKVKTARQIAMDLGRSYNAIMMRAFKAKIPLMTEDKRCGRLQTDE